MPDSDLQKRAVELRKEITNLRQASAEVDPYDIERMDHRARLRTICALRERELEHVEAHLAKES